MIIQNKFKISGYANALPNRCIQNVEFEERYKLPKGKIYNSIGVRQRYHVEEETNTQLGYEAAKRALQSANMGLADIDCIVSAAATFDHVLPNRSSLLKHALDAQDVYDMPCLDINTACTSFITALDYSANMIELGRYKNVLIVSAEVSSKGLNPNDMHTSTLFGDAAAAVVISHSSKGQGGISYKHKTYSEACMDTIIPAGGNAKHPKDFPFDPALYSFNMNGKKLLKVTLLKLKRFVDQFLKDNGVSFDEIDFIIPHQASKLGLQMFESLFPVEGKVIQVLENYGNCIAASIPFALNCALERKQVKSGQLGLLVGTASGLGISAYLIKL